jgi:cell division protein FtsW
MATAGLEQSGLEHSGLGQWWLSVDRALLATLIALLCAGVLVSQIASPAIALRRGLDLYHFVNRQAGFALIGGAVLLAASFLSPLGVRRAALLVVLVALPALLLVLYAGPVINGSRRWLVFGGWQLQPSEFLKPALIVLFAWGLTQKRQRPEMPALLLSGGAVLASMALLIQQPDLGQTVLIGGVCLTLFYLAGRPMRELAIVGTAAVGGLVLFYLSFDHVRSRVDRHIDPSQTGGGDTYQIDKAIASFLQGGWLGRGPGEGVIKTKLPDAHTDYILAVIGEEYGAMACIALMLAFGFILARAGVHVWRQRDMEVRLASAGLALLLAGQSLFHIGVNSGILPTKGMTLPFISYGGSSLLGTCFAAGLLLALTRGKPQIVHERPVLILQASAA